MLKSTYSSVLRFKNLKTDAQILGAGKHNLRTRPPINADPAKADDNTVEIGGDKTPLELINERIQKLGIVPHSNSVRAIEVIMSAGKPFFSRVSKEVWIKDSVAFLEKKFGDGNVVHATLHMDETTAHLHLLVVPAVKAHYKDGASYKNNKKREWKLSAKSITHSLAHLRGMTSRRTDSSLFSENDILDIKKLARKLDGHLDLPAKFVWENCPEAHGTIMQCHHFIRRNKEARAVLVTQLNNLIKGGSIDGPAFAGVDPSPEVAKLRAKKSRTADETICLNRMLLEDAFSNEISTRRPIGSASAPFLHLCQKEYYELCEKLDAQISAPCYKVKLPHEDLTEWNGRVAEAINRNTAEIDIKFDPPNAIDLLNPSKYLQEQSAKIVAQVEKAVELAVVKGAKYDLIAEEHERLKENTRVANEVHEKETEALRNRICQLENQNRELLSKLRSIPLESVMEKFGYDAQILNGKVLYHLPDDRVLSISQPRFSELTTVGGLGTMSGRHAGRGAIDLVIFVTGWDLTTARRWLCKQFSVDETLADERDRQEELRPELESVPTKAELDQYKAHDEQTFLPAQGRWAQVREWLISDNAFSPDLIDRLHRGNKIWANSWGAVVFPKYYMAEFVGAIVMGPHPNAHTGKNFHQDFGPKAIGYSLGGPVPDYRAIVDSPLEALSYREIFGSDTNVTATGSQPTPEFLAQFAQRHPDPKMPVMLAFERGKTGDEHAKVAEAVLESAGIKTFRQSPPDILDQTNTWSEILRASKGRLQRLADASVQTVQSLIETAKNWLSERLERFRLRIK